MDKKKIDLSDIKSNDLDKTASFTDLMTRAERKRRKLEKENKEYAEKIKENDDIEEMVEERKKSTKDLTKDLQKVNELYENDSKKEKEKKEEELEESISKTQIQELTRQIKCKFEENKKENLKNKKKGISVLNVIGEINLLCIGYYIYLLAFTNYQKEQKTYIFTGCIIVFLVLLFGLSVITNKKYSKVFNILNILAILLFVAYNAYTLFQ